MSNTPLVTVLMPCYNALPYLPEALESIINQTYTNLEILCINDGSTDETGEVLERYAKSDSRIRVIHNAENIRLIKTLNKGIDIATGEYIARMDADDIALPQRIEKQLRYLETHKHTAIISSGFMRITEAGRELKSSIPICLSGVACAFASFFITPLSHPTVFCRSQFLQENKYATIEIAHHSEDFELWTRLIRKTVRISNIPDVLQKNRINSKSVSHTFESIQIENFISLVQEHHSAMGIMPVERKVAKIVGLRADQTVSPGDLKEALWVLKQLGRKYLSKAEKNEKKEIKTIEAYVFLSIILQGLKRGSFLYKLACAMQAASKVNYFFNRQAWRFLLHR
ncbi:MAG: glycosyltransferase family 2 protein [Salinivirgaceae bacterium]